MSADIFVVVVLSIIVTTIVVIIVDYRERSVWIGTTYHGTQQQSPALLPSSPAASANSGVELVAQRVSQSACDGAESTMHVVRVVSETDARLNKSTVYA
jgi:hypothetical protein|mmetsp:Transcript_64340/g.176599  ORF Transcript_64340/g.176599 Transcript_64340/m.176599 type:complete len:99 (+) Transcript_64340:127-423(+)|eukprot:7123191-Prymnesium_polylepis.1